MSVGSSALSRVTRAREGEDRSFCRHCPYHGQLINPTQGGLSGDREHCSDPGGGAGGGAVVTPSSSNVTAGSQCCFVLISWVSLMHIFFCYLQPTHSHGNLLYLFAVKNILNCINFFDGLFAAVYRISKRNVV